MIAKALRNKIAWSTIVQTLGRVIHIALGIIIVKVLTNAIGVEQFGLYGKVTEYALFFAVAANLGIFGNTVRKMADHPKDGELFFNAMFLRIITALIIFAGGFTYAIFFIEQEFFQIALLYVMASLFFEFITSVCNASLQANYWMGRATLSSLLGRGLELLTILYLSKNFIWKAPEYNTEPVELWGEIIENSTSVWPSISPYFFFFLAPLFGALLTMCIHLFLTRFCFKWKWKLNKKLLKTLFLTALPFGIINIVNNIYFRFLPSYIASDSLLTSEFGSYSLYLAMANTAALLSTFLMFSTLPELKKAIQEGKIKRAKELYKTAQKILMIFAPLLVLGGLILGPLFVQLVSNESFVDINLFTSLILLFTLAAISYFYDLVLITLFALEKDMWFLKREFLALGLGGLFFLIAILWDTSSGTLMVGNYPLYFQPGFINLNLGLIGAIVAVTSMVIMGHKKIAQSWEKAK